MYENNVTLLIRLKNILPDPSDKTFTLKINVVLSILVFMEILHNKLLCAPQACNMNRWRRICIIQKYGFKEGHMENMKMLWIVK